MFEMKLLMSSGNPTLEIIGCRAYTLWAETEFLVIAMYFRYYFFKSHKSYDTLRKPFDA